MKFIRNTRIALMALIAVATSSYAHIEKVTINNHRARGKDMQATIEIQYEGMHGTKIATHKADQPVPAQSSWEELMSGDSDLYAVKLWSPRGWGTTSPAYVVYPEKGKGPFLAIDIYDNPNPGWTGRNYTVEVTYPGIEQDLDVDTFVNVE